LKKLNKRTVVTLHNCSHFGPVPYKSVIHDSYSTVIHNESRTSNFSCVIHNNTIDQMEMIMIVHVKNCCIYRIVVLKQGVLKKIVAVSFKGWVKHSSCFGGSNEVKSVIVAIHSKITLKLENMWNIWMQKSAVCNVKYCWISFLRFNRL